MEKFTSIIEHAQNKYPNLMDEIKDLESEIKILELRLSNRRKYLTTARETAKEYAAFLTLNGINPEELIPNI